MLHRSLTPAHARRAPSPWALCFGFGLSLTRPALCTAQQLRLPDAPSLLWARQHAIGTPGHVSGTVADRYGALIAGATVVLSDASGQTHTTTSDDAGTFHFGGVPLGPFHVTLSLQGFLPQVIEGELSADRPDALEPVVLVLAPVAQNVQVTVSNAEIAEEQIHLEEQQRLVGFLPNFYVSYNWNAVPLTTKQKYKLSLHNAADPGNLLLVGMTAGAQQATDAFPGYGQGAAGYGRRYGADLGNLVTGTFLGGAVLPSLFHQDPRYFYKGTGTLRSRILYAASTAVRCRGDNGKRQIAWASMLGDMSAGAVSNLYYAPGDRQGATLTIENGFLGIAGDALNGLVQEFVLPRFTSRGKPKP